MTQDVTYSEARPRGGAIPALLLFLLLAPLLTWPMAASLDQPHCARGDYFSNIWNAWWVGTALGDPAASLYQTDYLHYPRGLSLARHTLSPVNSVPGAALARLCDPFTSINLIILLHFALSGFTMFLLARELTGSARGATLAGLVYSFSPFHLYYMAELNVSSLEFPPLAALCFVRCWRHGGLGNALAAAAAGGLLALSSSYYLVYCFLLACLMLALGGLLGGGTPYRQGARNLVVAGLVTAPVVVAAAWPLLSVTLLGDPSGAAAAVDGHQANRVNDLLGYNWSGPPDKVLVAWPAMVGYVTLLIVLLGARGLLRQPFWILAGLAFFLLSLGGTLHVGGEPTAVRLPYAWLEELPVLSMLRKADRAFVMVLLAGAVLVAASWRRIEERLRRPALAHLAFAAGGAALAFELSAAPFAPFADRPSALFDALRADDTVRSVVELPANPGSNQEGRYMLSQVRHGKRFPQGYATNLALTDDHVRDAKELIAAQRLLDQGNARPLLAVLEGRGIDAIVLRKTAVRQRAPGPLHQTTVWAPFVVHGRALAAARQQGGLVERPVDERILRQRRGALAALFGEPEREDDQAALFRVRR